MPPKPRPTLPPLNPTIGLPKESDRVTYWTNYLAADATGQHKLQADKATFRLNLWGGIPDELRQRVWAHVLLASSNSSIVDVIADNAKPKFISQLEAISSTYNLFTPESKHISQNQVNTINMVLRFGATSFDLENYIAGSFDLIAAAILHIPQLTPLFQLFKTLYATNQLFWKGTIKETRAVQTFVLTSMGILHRDKIDVLEKLSNAGLDLSDLFTIAKQWLYSYGAQFFSFAFTRRLIDIMLLDDIGPAALSATFTGILLHWAELSTQPSAHPASSPTAAGPNSSNLHSKERMVTIQTLYEFPTDPRLSVDRIFYFAYQYFIHRFPDVELAFLDINWASLLQLPQGTGFQIFKHPRFAYLLGTGSPNSSISASTFQSSSSYSHSHSTLTPIERLHYLSVTNPVFESDLFPQYKLLFTQLTQMPGYSPIGGYNTLPLRLLDVGKVLALVNHRFSTKRHLLYRKQRKSCPNQLLSASQPSRPAGLTSSAAYDDLTQSTPDPGKALQKKLSVLHKSLRQFSTNLKKIIDSANSTQTPSQQGSSGTWLRSSENEAKQLTAYVDPIIKLLNERIALHLYELPPTSVHQQDFPQLTKSTAPESGTIPFSALAQYLQRPYLTMEGYLFRAHLYHDPTVVLTTPPTSPTPLSSTSTPILSPPTPTAAPVSQILISSIETRFIKLQAPFLMEFENSESSTPINNRCYDLRGRAIVADRTPSGDYGYGITIYQSKDKTQSKNNVLLQFYSSSRGEFERWLASLASAVALPGAPAPAVVAQPPLQLAPSQQQQQQHANSSSSHGTTTGAKPPPSPIAAGAGNAASSALGQFGPAGTLRVNVSGSGSGSGPSGAAQQFGPSGTLVRPTKPPPTPTGLTNHQKKL